MLNSSENSITQLEEVFATFNKVSDELGSSYRFLEKRVEELCQELAEARSERLEQLCEKELLASKLFDLLAALPGGVLTLNSLGIVENENPAAIKILEKSFKGYSWDNIVTQVSFCEYTPYNGEINLKNGARVSLNSTDFGTDGERIILLTDVTENFRLNTIINRDKRLSALGEMAARLAHQIRTPLSAGILYLSHLDTKVESREKAAEIKSKVLNRLDQVEKLTESMLTYIRGGMYSNDEVSLNQLLLDVEDAHIEQIRKFKGSILTELPDIECLIHGNRDALFNALSNLIENAVQAVKGFPVIILSLSAEQQVYKISVTDNGPGIDESLREKIFDPFFSTRTNGTGLGLAVVSSAIKAHKGEIGLEQAYDGGSTFKIIIPANNSQEEADCGIWVNTKHQSLEHIN